MRQSNIPAAAATSALSNSFNTGRYSDISVLITDSSSQPDVLRLHRVILSQCSLMTRLMDELDHCPEKNRDGLLRLSCPDRRIEASAVKLAIHELYMNSNGGTTSDSIRSCNALKLLAASIFLDMEDLTKSCSTWIQSNINTSTILIFARHLHDFGPRGRDETLERYAVLLNSWVGVLTNHCLHYISMLLNSLMVGAIVNTSSSEAEVFTSPEQLLSALPLSWCQQLIESSLICFQDDFHRYNVLKRLMIIRCACRPEDLPSLASSASNFGLDIDSASFYAGKTVPSEYSISSFHNSKPLDQWSEAGDSVMAEKTSQWSISGAVLGTFSSLIGRKSAANDLYGKERPVKRMRMDDGLSFAQREGSVQFGEESNRSSGFRAPLQRGYQNSKGGDDNDTPYNSEIESDIELIRRFLGIFGSSIVYTYMSFKQLNDVEGDKLVPRNTVTEPLWIQKALKSLFDPSIPNKKTIQKFPKFRFSVCFQDVRAAFNSATIGSDKTKSLISRSVECGGVQYSVILRMQPSSHGIDESLEHITEQNIAPQTASGFAATSLNESNVAKSPRSVRSPSSLKAFVKRHRPTVVSADLHRERSDSISGLTLDGIADVNHDKKGVNTSISYTIHVHDESLFEREQYGYWEKYNHPVTVYNHRGGGFSETFAMPTGTSKSSRPDLYAFDGAVPETSNITDDLWLVVEITFCVGSDSEPVPQAA